MLRNLSLSRAEGMTEYVIIVGLISACVMVGMFRFGGAIQDFLEKAEICINCDHSDGDHEKPAVDDETGEEPGDSDAPVVDPPWWNDPSSVLYWFAQLIRWFGGAPHVYDALGGA